ncbi:23S rRNA pseudouridine2604 synthase [Lewinella marina]|uniref:Pseudouridine synthase n=1 Tax=Neolewinella marina TaxID=438751 RepID=A0A2G0CI02_9BACT|nr:pseudouridine synthase [Neolewinella marina]NJB85327.1 23S rRNA pseudouridine2604 synthase [Neolewinella marina]PHK99557.1 23S rRNA pseudouridine synthase F [Neolewinella marina]
MPDSISLNKYVAETGICSRREADRWIEAGRLAINGTIAVKGNRVEEGDRVTLDGQPIGRRPPPVYLAFHKPAGVTSTTDPKDPDNLIDFINYPERIFPVGRLDKASTGLLLLTNDGDIVNEVLRVENNHEKEYIVTVDQPVTDRFVRKMAGGLPILGTRTNPCEVERIGPRAFRIVLTQGLNRQIRRMCELLGYRVLTLKRIRIMHIELGDLPVGQYREMGSFLDPA